MGVKMFVLINGKYVSVKDIKTIKLVTGFSGNAIEVITNAGTKYFCHELDVIHGHKLSIKTARQYNENLDQIRREFAEAINRGAFTYNEANIDLTGAEDIVYHYANIQFQKILRDGGENVATLD